MALFDNSNIKLDVLKKRAFNYRWAEVTGRSNSVDCGRSGLSGCS